jgi:hypothetical protein
MCCQPSAVDKTIGFRPSHICVNHRGSTPLGNEYIRICRGLIYQTLIVRIASSRNCGTAFRNDASLCCRLSAVDSISPFLNGGTQGVLSIRAQIFAPLHSHLHTFALSHLRTYSSFIIPHSSFLVSTGESTTQQYHSRSSTSPSLPHIPSPTRALKLSA